MNNSKSQIDQQIFKGKTNGVFKGYKLLGNIEWDSVFIKNDFQI